jgi:uncharacterized tellurite resistance protein B-like protein
MNNNSQNSFGGAISSIFGARNPAQNSEVSKRFKCAHVKKELELALAVLLVDLASCDQNFEQQEYQVISNGLKRMFGTGKSDVQALVNQANTVLKNLRGTSRFAEMLKDNLSHEERQHVMELINEVIDADGQEDGFETYLRHKFAKLLGFEIKIVE